MNSLKEYIFDRHDNYCNQKYAMNLPYSFHLQCVIGQGKNFAHLLKEGEWTSFIFPALAGHDLIEDTGLTFNDLVKVLGVYGYESADIIADIVYCVTDEKGKTRAERKNDKYYFELSQNKLAIFVKLSDIAANTLFSKLTGSSMYKKYKSEFSHFKEKCYVEEYSEFFKYVSEI